MRGIDKTVLRETGYIALWELIFSAVLQAVFLIISKWDFPVLWGNLLSGSIAVANFLLMGLTVQAAVDKEEKRAKLTMQLSQMLRTLMLFATAAVGVLLPVFNTWAVIIPLFFPRIAIMLRPMFSKKN